jgi:hypothetical protein
VLPTTLPLLYEAHVAVRILRGFSSLGTVVRPELITEASGHERSWPFADDEEARLLTSVRHRWPEARLRLVLTERPLGDERLYRGGRTAIARVGDGMRTPSRASIGSAIMLQHLLDRTGVGERRLEGHVSPGCVFDLGAARPQADRPARHDRICPRCLREVQRVGIDMPRLLRCLARIHAMGGGRRARSPEVLEEERCAS